MTQKMKRYLDAAKQAKMVGWDFSVIEPLIKEDPLPFNYIDIVNRYRHQDMTLLDMETGGGEILESFHHPANLTYVTEGYHPNYVLCQERLAAKGIKVIHVDGDDFLPFASQMFDIVINRHGAYRVDEVYRILKPEGLFITQQVGSKNNLPLRSILTSQELTTEFSLSSEQKNLESTGFKVLEADEVLQKVMYLDIDAVIFMATVISWEFPGFDVISQAKKLDYIDKIMIAKGYFESYEHRFYMVCQKHCHVQV